MPGTGSQEDVGPPKSPKPRPDELLDLVSVADLG